MLNKAKQVLGTNTIKDTIHASLDEVVRRRKLEVLADALGTIPLELTIPQLRAQRKNSHDMFLVDTSVWIHALRPSGSPQIQALVKPLIINGEAALTDWILLELMTGLRKQDQPEQLLEYFSPLSRVTFDSSWWPKAWSLAATLRRKGVSPSAADCLIATTAIEQGLTLLHCDGDFEHMKPHSSLQALNLRKKVTKL